MLLARVAGNRAASAEPAFQNAGLFGNVLSQTDDERTLDQGAHNRVPDPQIAPHKLACVPLTSLFELVRATTLQAVGVVIGDDLEADLVSIAVEGRVVDPGQAGGVEHGPSRPSEVSGEGVLNPQVNQVAARGLRSMLQDLRWRDGGELAEGRVEAGIEERGLDRLAWRGDRLVN